MPVTPFPAQPDPLKNPGPPCSDTAPQPTCGQPINPGTGNMYEIETDYADPTSGGLSISRTYNSKPFSSDATSHTLGASWTQAYDSVLTVESIPWSGQTVVPTCWRREDTLTVWCEYPQLATSDTTHQIVSILRGDGKKYLFRYTAGASLTFVSDADVNDTVTKVLDINGNLAGWTYVSARGDKTERYDATGVLISVTNRAGAKQQFTHSNGVTNNTGTGRSPATAPACSNVQAGAVLPAGRLLCVTDDWGRQLQFEYDTQGRITKAITPANQAYLYAYDGPSGGCTATAPTSRACSAGNLTQITYPDGKKKTYYYNEAAQINGGVACPNTVAIGNGYGSLLNALTGVIDENGARHMSWTYDCAGRATSSQLAGGVEKVSLAYGTNATTVTHYLGTPATPQTTVRTYSYQTILGVAKNIGIDQPCVECGGIKSQTYDANGNAISRTDWNGNITTYIYDLTRNLETSRTEAAGTAQARTITTNWHPSYRLPVQISEPGRTTAFTYDATGNLLQKTVTAGSQARTWSYTYNAWGQVTSADGPRSDVADVTRYGYDAQGNLATITNALGHTTQISAYDLHGNPLTVIDPNGLTTQLAYDARSRLISRSAGGETTTYQHDGVGQLTRITQPDGSTLNYTYDAAHRLTAVSDGLGNQIQYTLDAIGNRTREEVRDPTGALTQLRQRVYDALNRLAQDIGAQNQSTAYRYDANGNRTGVTDPLGRDTASAFDPLNRLIRVTDPSGGQTQYDYDGQNRLTRVTDPRNLATTYQQDGLGNTLQQASPDTGTTASTYDPAGNPTTRTDAKGQTTAYQYDALNRVTRIGYQDGAETRYTWDQGQNGLGRLGKIEDTVGGALASAIQYSYDPQGRVNAETRTVNGIDYTIAYRYSGGKLAGLTYPSGRQLTYTRDNGGNIAEVRLTDNDQTKVLATNIQYQPFGGIKTYTDGAGQTHSRSYDQDGRIAAYSLVGQNWLLGYDAASRITAQIDGTNAANSAAYGYDSLDRLTGAVLPAANYGYGYDPTGNRTSQTNGATTRNYTTDSASNRLLAIDTGPAKAYAYDANGSITDDGMSQLAYDARGRLTQVTTAAGATQYQINGLGQRIRKSGSDDTVYLYDTAGHLLAETTPTGQTLREYIYLNDIPLVVLQ